MAEFDESICFCALLVALSMSLWLNCADPLLVESAATAAFSFCQSVCTEDEGFIELSAKIGQLKMASADGKYSRTDAADRETVLRIVQSVPSPKAEPVKRWLAKMGTQQLVDSGAHVSHPV
jgi:hypothetical protein